MGLEWRGKSKKVIGDYRSFSVNNMELPVIKWNEVYKYLGVKVGLKGPTKWVGGVLRDSLKKVAGAALKPQQKMFLIRKYLLPKFYYQVVHQRITVAILSNIDKCIRKTVRRILHLPHDTPTHMFHNHPSCGGLAVPELVKVVPSLLEGLKSRMEVRGGFWLDVAECLKIPRSRRMRRKRVVYFCDGRGLGEACKQSACYKWLTEGTRMMSGSTFVEAIKIRQGLVVTKERSSRGRARRLKDVVCDLGCRKTEKLGHIPPISGMKGMIR